MLCYTCETGPHPGGMHFGIPEALGICHDCGIGVCGHHGRREGAGEPFLCTDCAAHRTRAARVEREPMTVGAA